MESSSAETSGRAAVDIQIEDRDLPVLSVVATRAMEMIEGDKFSGKELEKLILADPGLTTRILRVANSPIYSGKTRIASISDAAARLGLMNLKTTILAAACGEVFDQSDPVARGFWRHATAAGVAARWLALKLKAASPEEAFIAGLLHDIGKPIIYRQAPDFYRGLIEETAASGGRLYLEERARIGYCSHESIGGLVGRKWLLADPTIEAIRFHHEVEAQPNSVPQQNLKFIALVSLANLLANKLGWGSETSDAIDLARSPAAEILAVTASDLEGFTSELPQVLTDQEGALG